MKGLVGALCWWGLGPGPILNPALIMFRTLCLFLSILLCLSLAVSLVNIKGSRKGEIEDSIWQKRNNTPAVCSCSRLDKKSDFIKLQ